MNLLTAKKQIYLLNGIESDMPDELKKATEIFLTGTAAEVTPVGAIDGMTFKVGDLTRLMMEDYDKAVGKDAHKQAPSKHAAQR